MFAAIGTFLTALFVYAQTAPSSGVLDPGIITAFGVAGPTIAILFWLVVRSERQSSAKDAEIKRVTEKLFEFQERYGGTLAQVVDTLKEVARMIDRLDDPSTGNARRTKE